MVRKCKALGAIAATVLFFSIGTSASNAIDSEVTRRTLAGIPGVTVVVEELQPNILKYASKFSITRDQLRTGAEASLANACITVLSYEQWLRTPGKPFLYIVVNTNEYERYWFAYDIRIQLKQRVLLELNPSIVTMADTWGISMTGNVNIGKLNTLKENVNALLERFIDAYLAANHKTRQCR